MQLLPPITSEFSTWMALVAIGSPLLMFLVLSPFIDFDRDNIGLGPLLAFSLSFGIPLFLAILHDPMAGVAPFHLSYIWIAELSAVLLFVCYLPVILLAKSGPPVTFYQIEEMRLRPFTAQQERVVTLAIVLGVIAVSVWVLSVTRAIL